MKLIHIISKNFRVLLRSKTTALMLLVGPLFIIILVGLAFNTQTQVKFVIGVNSLESNTTEKYTELAEQFITILSDANYTISRYQSEDVCVEDIKRGIIHACITFPPGFEIGNNKSNEIVFYVDQTRSNLVYEIQNALASKVQFQSSQLSTGLTNNLLSVISESSKTNDDNLVRLLKMKTKLDSTDQELTNISAKIASIDLTTGNISFDNANAKILEIESDLIAWDSDAQVFLGTSKQFVTQLEIQYPAVTNANSSFNTVNYRTSWASFNDSETSNFNASGTAVEDMKASLDSTKNSIDVLRDKINTAQNTQAAVKNRVDALKTKTADLQADVTAVKASIDALKGQINAISVTNAANIVNPITTRIQPVVSKNTNLAYFFPYLVVLIVMFISLVLSSTLVVMEKTSKAYFRNFVTPTRDLTMIIATFITNFLVVAIEIAVILSMAAYFLSTSLFSNIMLVIVLLVLCISLFTLIGMSLGYLLRTQEGSMVASIAVGSIFLLLSNLIIPLESMAKVIQNFTPLNPYVVSSEVLRKLIIFKLEWTDLMPAFLFLAVLSAVIFVAMVIIQRLSKVRYFTKMPHVKEKPRDQNVARDIPSFKLANNVLLTSLEDLIRELETMDDEVFFVHVNKRKNDFYTWIKDGIEDKELAEKIKGKTEKDELRKVLLKELEK